MSMAAAPDSLEIDAAISMLQRAVVPVVVTLRKADSMTGDLPPPWCGMVPRSSLVLALRAPLLAAFGEVLPSLGDQPASLWLSVDEEQSMEQGHIGPNAAEVKSPTPDFPVLSQMLPWNYTIGVIADRYRFIQRRELPIMLVARCDVVRKAVAGKAPQAVEVPTFANPVEERLFTLFTLKSALGVLCNDAKPFLMRSPNEVTAYVSHALSYGYDHDVAKARAKTVEYFFSAEAPKPEAPKAASSSAESEPSVETQDLPAANDVVEESETIIVAATAAPKAATSGASSPLSARFFFQLHGGGFSRRIAITAVTAETIGSCLQKAVTMEEFQSLNFRRSIVCGVPYDAAADIPVAWAAQYLTGADLMLHVTFH